MRIMLLLSLLMVAAVVPDSRGCAPVIVDFPPFVISDDGPVSNSNIFVFEDDGDGIDLLDPRWAGNVGCDPVVGELIWTFYMVDSKYLINGAGPLDLAGGENPRDPPPAKIIAGPGSLTSDDPRAMDSRLHTIVIRNEDLSPIAMDDGASDPGYAEPAQNGILASETRIVTLFMSDGDSADSDTTTIFTENNFIGDRLSQGGLPVDAKWDFSDGPQGWVFGEAAASGITSSFSNALCLTAPPYGENIGAWDSPYGVVQMVDRAFWELRYRMSTTQTVENSIPLWDIIVRNAVLTAGDANNPGNLIGANAFGGDYFHLSNIGGSQGIGTPNGRTEFRAYFVPPAVNLPNWRSTQHGAFKPEADGFNDLAFHFRIFDIFGGFDVGGGTDSTICLEVLTISRGNLDNLRTKAIPYELSDLTPTNTDLRTLTQEATNVSYNGGNATISRAFPTGWDSNIDTLVPGRFGMLPPSFGVNSQADFEAAFPVVWESDKLYVVEFDISAPTEQDSLTQPDVYVFMMEGAGGELFHTTALLPNVGFTGSPGAGRPPVAPSVGTYLAMVYSNNESAASEFKRLRPRMDLQHFPGLTFQTGGSLTIHRIAVKETRISAFP